MSLKDLVGYWEDESHGTLTKDTYTVNLSVKDAARIDALSDMYPKRTKEQIIGDLLSTILSDLESSFPYVQGSEVVSTDEMGDPVFEDIGQTPLFLSLTKKHYSKRKNAINKH